MDKSSGSSDSRDITLGCGSELGTPPITLNITTTTGGSFSVLVDVQNSVENLKKIIAKKLKVAKDRICLLHRERELQEGSLKENGLADGSKIILIPNVETGLLAQRPENTVMQALESLNDSQVNDFLSGKTPLNLSMRLGDHMMLIQLQLSTVNPSSPSHGGSRSRSSQRSSRSSSSSSSNTTTTIPANTTATTTTAAAAATTTNQTQTSTRKIDIDATNNSRHNNSTVNLDSSSRLSNSISVDGSSSSSSINSLHGGDLNSFLSKHDFENLQNIVKSLSIAQTTTACNNDEPRTLTCLPPPPPLIPQPDIALEQSPIKSLSNLVSSPIKTTSLKNIPVSNHFTAEASNSGTTTTADRTSTCSDPISAKLTSCLCKRLDSSKNCEINQCQSRHDTATTTTIYENNETPERVTATSTPVKQMPGLLHRTANNPFVRVKHRNHHSVSNNLLKKNTNSTEKLRTSTDNNSMPSTSSATDNATADPMCDVDEPIATISATDSRALAEASRNLTQTLRKLSKEVFTNKVDLTEETPRKSGSGAVIESMKNHGKGIYSGTFSGTLNPALQDRYGRPKRDISTVIHILNDLLSATPQYSRGARISFEAPTSRNNTKQSTTKHHTVTSTQDSCGKCHNSSKLNTCAYGECNGHYNSSTLGSTSVPSAETCQRNGDNSQIASCSCHDISSGTNSSFSDNSSADLNSSDNRSACTCSFRSHSGVAASSAAAASASSSSSSTTTATPLSYHTTTTTTNEDGNICNKCSIEIENNKTKCKLDQLRLVMQQRKQKREARKLKGAPYGARVVSTTSGSSSSAATASTIAPLTSPSEVSPNHMVEEVDTAA